MHVIPSVIISCVPLRQLVELVSKFDDVSISDVALTLVSNMEVNLACSYAVSYSNNNISRRKSQR